MRANNLLIQELKMRKLSACIALALLLVSGFGCTNMNRTQQGVMSGAALGALGGAGISAISGGAAGWGAVAGAGVGALAGGIIGHNEERRWR